MVKHCCYKDCNKDTRYHPEAVFIPFVKPKTDRKRCLRWVHLCGREKSDFNVDKVNYVSLEIEVCRYICLDLLTIEKLDLFLNETKKVQVHRQHCQFYDFSFTFRLLIFLFS